MIVVVVVVAGTRPCCMDLTLLTGCDMKALHDG